MSGRKILFVNHWARDLGGAERSLLDILSMAPDDVECHLATTERGHLTEEAERLGTTIHVVRCSQALRAVQRWGLLKTLVFSWRTLIAYCAYVLRLRSLIKTIKPDIIHANVPKSHIAVCIVRKLGIRSQSAFHIREIFAHPSLAAVLYAVLFPRHNSRVIAISQAVHDALPTRMQHASTVLHNGVEIPKRHRWSTNRAPGGKVLYLGRIVPWKGCDELVHIARKFADDRPEQDLRLTLVGGTFYWPSSYREHLQDLINTLGLEKTCALEPNTNDPMRALMEHDLFVNASVNEPFGRSIAEAQACGLPVVACDSGGVAEIVESNVTGILVPHNNREAFANALGELLSDPQRMKRMGMAARERMQTHFNRIVQVGKFWELVKHF